MNFPLAFVAAPDEESRIHAPPRLVVRSYIHLYICPNSRCQRRGFSFNLPEYHFAPVICPTCKTRGARLLFATRRIEMPHEDFYAAVEWYLNATWIDHDGHPSPQYDQVWDEYNALVRAETGRDCYIPRNLPRHRLPVVRNRSQF